MDIRFGTVTRAVSRLCNNCDNQTTSGNCSIYNADNMQEYTEHKHGPIKMSPIGVECVCFKHKGIFRVRWGEVYG